MAGAVVIQVELPAAKIPNLDGWRKKGDPSPVLNIPPGKVQAGFEVASDYNGSLYTRPILKDKQQ